MVHSITVLNSTEKTLSSYFQHLFHTVRYDIRHLVQAVWTIIINAHVTGFLTGRIYRGRLKNFCVPGLNCYSCPGALGACPIGALQAVIGSRHYSFTFYIVGFLMFVGGLAGRFVCGWLCPFGFIQELLHKLPFPVKIKTFRGDRVLRKLKYAVLVVFVIVLPLTIVDVLGQGAPYFCKWICPAGTLEGGIPLTLLNDKLRSAVGFRYVWKLGILAVTIIAAIIIYRPFCKYLCPLGAIYSVFNPVSVFRYRVDMDKCVQCGTCSRNCDMGCDPVINANDMECIRCGKCKNSCPKTAICCGFTRQIRH